MFGNLKLKACNKERLQDQYSAMKTKHHQELKICDLNEIATQAGLQSGGLQTLSLCSISGFALTNYVTLVHLLTSLSFSVFINMVIITLLSLLGYPVD